MPIDQVKVIEIGADAIEEVLLSSAGVGLAYPPKLMHAVVAALGRHGFIIEDRYEDTDEESDQKSDWYFAGDDRIIPEGELRTAPDWETSGDDA